MSVQVTFDNSTRTGTVTITDLQDQARNPVTGVENMLLQAAIDRAAANTARVSLMQVQLQDQSDRINLLNQAMGKFLTNQPTDPAREGGTVAVNLTAAEIELLRKTKDSSGTSFIEPTYFTGNNPITLAAGKTFNDLMTAMKSAINQETNLNQQTMINYQSLINQRNQMTEWVAALIMLLATAASGTVTNLR